MFNGKTKLKDVGKNTFTWPCVLSSRLESAYKKFFPWSCNKKTFKYVLCRGLCFFICPLSEYMQKQLTDGSVPLSIMQWRSRPRAIAPKWNFLRETKKITRNYA